MGEQLDYKPVTYGRIVRFWSPLAGAWLMMSVEGPFLAAIIARLQLPTENLAAYGVAFAFALIIEAPVIMLLSAATALVKGRDSYLALRRFTYTLNAVLTALMVVTLLPPVFRLLTETLLNLPEQVAALTLRSGRADAPLAGRHRLPAVLTGNPGAPRHDPAGCLRDRHTPPVHESPAQRCRSPSCSDCREHRSAPSDYRRASSPRRLPVD